MWRRLSSALSVLTMTAGMVLVASTGADAAAVTVTNGGVTYRADDAAVGAGATVVSVDGTAPKALVLPTTVTIGGTAYDVTSIAPGAAEILGLTSLTLPGRLVTIGESAFLGNTLTSLVLPSTVTSVGNAAFLANSLSSVTLGSSLQSIGEGTFAGNQLSAVNLPASLRVIDSGAFVTNEISTVTIPASVTVVDDAAFADNPLSIVLFTGRPPTTFTSATPASGSPIGSLGDGRGLTVFYPAQFGAPGFPGGFTSPTWRGYAASAVGASVPTPTSPSTPPGAGQGSPQLVINGVRVVRKAHGVVVFKISVSNTGGATARGVRVIIKNRPHRVTYPTKKAGEVGSLAARANATTSIKAKINMRGKTKFIFKALADNAPRATAKVRLPARRR